jgi:hypothetical protein
MKTVANTSIQAKTKVIRPEVTAAILFKEKKRKRLAEALYRMRQVRSEQDVQTSTNSARHHLGHRFNRPADIKRSQSFFANHLHY